MARDPVVYRTFLALPLGEAFSAAVEPVLTDMKSKIPGVKWVDASQIHLTLHFFGPTSSDQIQSIAECVMPVSQSCPPLRLTLSEVGFFPNTVAPRIIWIGLTGMLEELTLLRRGIEQALAKADFACEARPFRPHVTLGRVRPGQHAGIPNAFGVYSDAPAVTKVIDRVVLFASTLTNTGPRYDTLQTFLLSEKPRP